MKDETTTKRKFLELESRIQTIDGHLTRTIELIARIQKQNDLRHNDLTKKRTEETEWLCERLHVQNENFGIQNKIIESIIDGKKAMQATIVSAITVYEGLQKKIEAQEEYINTLENRIKSIESAIVTPNPAQGVN